MHPQSITSPDSRLPERFWQKIEVSPTGCWLWHGARNSSGYGHLLVGSRSDGSRHYVKAHRFAYERLVGPILTPHLDHLCRIVNCVNPAHLEPVSVKENIRRGEGHGKESHCPHGHAYDLLNTYYDSKGRRFCRACRKGRDAEIEARRRQRRVLVEVK